jgi:sigma-B regulation protein RsbU (phosphoserine phosphatase)
MAELAETYFRPQLEERRRRLTEAAARAGEDAALRRLLGEVDAALARLDDGTFGLCEECHDPIEPDRLVADPLTCFCLDHLSAAQQRDLERDLELAARIQRSLLPPSQLRLRGWELHLHWQPAGPVSGDFCDVLSAEDGSFQMLFGDVSGKGVAAAILMSHLHAAFRTLQADRLGVAPLVERINRVFRESAAGPHFATLVCARAGADGSVEVCNAGHCPPLLVSADGVRAIPPTGLPVGTFLSSTFTSTRVTLGTGDILLLYTDGVTECRGPDDVEFGEERLQETLAAAGSQEPSVVVSACLEAMGAHRRGAPMADDATLLAVRRT